MDNLTTTTTKAIVEAEPLAGLLADWLAALDASPATATTYRRGMLRFLAWLESHPGDVTAATIRAWREELLAAGNKPGSVNTWLAGVRSFFGWAVESGFVATDPAAGAKGSKRRGTGAKHKRDELTAREVRRVLATCDESLIGRRDLALISLMAYCALRQVEVHRADVEDLKTRNGRLVLWVQGKGHVEKDEFVVLPEAAETAVREWLPLHPTGKGALFVGLGQRGRGDRLALRSIRQVVKERFRQAGVVGQDKTTHSLRHSAISTAIRSGANIQQVQAMARHANVGTTMIYYHETQRTENPAEDYISY